MGNTKKQAIQNINFWIGLFTTSKFVQNLGSRNEVYKFDGYFRSAHGRD